MGEVWQKIRNRICLMGKIPPLEVLAKRSAEEVKSFAAQCILKTKDSKGLILSAEGGVSPGTPAQNIEALVETSRLPLTH